ncbi:unnamed protein product [Adineta steineri]|uniref:Uncharacterized protein n=1 Tax=Adineta steineri TaxID=433720 RepID=A0A813QNS8_9BILA|nr:unnamed protein product [Adineta steineri]
MLLLLLLFFCVPCITGDEDAILDQLRTEIALSKRMDQDHMIDFVCKLLASPEFIVASADDDFLSTILDELGFGALGVRRNTWAAKYQADPRKSATCFGTLHSGNRRVIRYFEQNQTDEQIIVSNIYCQGLTMDKNGFIYVSDYENHEVRRYKQGDSEGELVAGGRGKGDHLSQLDSPTFIFIDEDDSLYISDEQNNRVMKWKKGAKEGIIVTVGNDEGDRCLGLSEPQGVIVNHLGHIYVADSQRHRVMRWCEGDKEGEIVVGDNGEGSQSNQLNYPHGLSFDNEDNLYVADCGNSRIQRYEKL